VQNIDMMNLAGFCRNPSNWMKEAADAKGVPMTRTEPGRSLRHAVRGLEGQIPEEGGAEACHV
jgi:hypothetical protein